MKKDLMKWLHHYISPAFFVMLTASFILWYIAKLTYNYTTDLEISVKVGQEKFDVTCVVEGVGTNLFGYRLYKGGNVTIPLSELKYDRVETAKDQIIIDQQSLQNALSVRYSDIKVISVSTVPPVDLTQEEERKFLK